MDSHCVSRYARMVVLGTGVLYLATMIVVCIARMSYPFELELMEGNFLLEVNGLLLGKPLYAAPSLDSASLVYGPLYFYASAAAVKVFGARLLSLRLVSFLAALGGFALVYRFVERETGSRWFGALSGCLLAATFGVTGFWFDLARPDSLYLLLSLACAYYARFHTGLRGVALAALLFVGAFLTKQTALVIVLPMLGYFAFLGRRQLIMFVATIAVVGGGALAYLQHASSGWFFFYTFGVPSTVLTSKNMIVLFWSRQVLPLFGMSVLLALLYFLSARREDSRRPFAFYLSFSTGMIGASWLYSLNWGAYLNGLIPIAALLSILAGLGAHAALESFDRLSADVRTRADVCLWAMLVFQFLCLAYNPTLQVPDEVDIDAGQELAAKIAKIPGHVYLPYDTTLYAAASKEPYANLMNLRFLLAAPNQHVAERLRQEIREALRQKRFSAIVVDADWTQEALPADFKKELRDTYELRETISYPGNSVFRERTGLPIRPEFVYAPKSESPDSGNHPR